MPNSLELEGRPQDTRIVVAMSGGVDSSVTAALLKAEGYDVVGVTLQLYDHGAATHRKGACCAGRDIHDARNVAERIGIPHYVLDYEARFRAAVIEDFADSYRRGETPVPCIRCNERVKFRDLLLLARHAFENLLRALVLPHDDGAQRRAGLRVPGQDGLALMVQAARDDLPGRVLEHVGDRLDHDPEHLLAVLLHPPLLGVAVDLVPPCLGDRL